LKLIRRKSLNYRIFKPTNHQTPQALNVNGEALNEVKHRNPKTAKPQKRALPLKRRRHLNGEALNEVKQRSEKQRSHRNGEAIETAQRETAKP